MSSLDGQHVLVTGGAGFVGSHLVDQLVGAGAAVRVFDNQSTGHAAFLFETGNKVGIWNGSLSDAAMLAEALDGCDLVVHLAANADIRHGGEFPDRDFEQNVDGTRSVLRAMRTAGVRRIAFASTGAVYGNHSGFKIREDCDFPIQNSFYGASKVAAEALIQAYCSTFDMQAHIFRFVPMIGERYSHGHLFDFVKKLRANPYEIEVFGTGEERKYCVYVGDAMRAVLMGIEMGSQRINIFNVGNDSSYSIATAVKWVASRLGLHPAIHYTRSNWAGDNPNMHLDSRRMQSIGWYPCVSLNEGVNRTVDYLTEHPWLLERAS